MFTGMLTASFSTRNMAKYIKKLWQEHANTRRCEAGARVPAMTSRGKYVVTKQHYLNIDGSSYCHGKFFLQPPPRKDTMRQLCSLYIFPKQLDEVNIIHNNRDLDWYRLGLVQTACFSWMFKFHWEMTRVNISWSRDESMASDCSIFMSSNLSWSSDLNSELNVIMFIYLSKKSSSIGNMSHLQSSADLEDQVWTKFISMAAMCIETMVESRHGGYPLKDEISVSVHGSMCVDQTSEWNIVETSCDYIDEVFIGFEGPSTSCIGSWTLRDYWGWLLAYPVRDTDKQDCL